MEALGHRAIGEKRPDAAGERSRDAERIRKLFAVEAKDFGCARRRTEAPRGAGGMPAEVVVRPVAPGTLEHARGNIVSGNNRGEHRFARTACPERTDRRGHDCAGVAASAEVIELERVRCRAVDERGFACR